MADSRNTMNNVSAAFSDSDIKHSTHLANELKSLSNSGIQKAKECIDFLKFSEGLVRRDIDLIRMQLEIKLKKLESRLQAELRNMVETETKRLEKFIGDVKALETEPPNEDEHEFKIDELRSIADSIERKRFKFEVNKALEKSLDDIKSFGNIVIHRVNDTESVDGAVHKPKVTTVKRPLPNGLRRLSVDSGYSEMKSAACGDALEQAKAVRNNSERPSSVSNDRDCDYRSRGVDKMHGIVGGMNKTVNSRFADDATVSSESPYSTRSKKNEQRSEIDSIRCQIEKANGINRENKDKVVPRCDKTTDKRQVKTEKSSADWNNADPFSILRALKEQTSRTEENLKTLRQSNNEIGGENLKSEDLAINASSSHRSGNDNNNVHRQTQSKSGQEPLQQTHVDSNRHRALTSNRDLRSDPTTHSRVPDRNRNYSAKSANTDGDEDTESDRFENMDKVTRANELWFGRDRHRRRDNFRARRARSLSPKTVRFKMEEDGEESVDSDTGSEPGTDIDLNNDKNELQLSRRDTTSDNNNVSCITVTPGENVALDLNKDKKERQRSRKNSIPDKNNERHQPLRDTTPDNNNASRIIVKPGGNVESDERNASTLDINGHRQHKTSGVNNVHGQSNGRHGVSNDKTDISNVTNIGPCQNDSTSGRNAHTDSKRVNELEHHSGNDDKREVINYPRNTNHTLEPANMCELTGNGRHLNGINGGNGISRLQRLRNKRQRNRTIGGITEGVHQTMHSDADPRQSFRDNNTSNISEQVQQEAVIYGTKESDNSNDIKESNQNMERRRETILQTVERTGGGPENARLERLRNRRKRNRTISGLTTSAHEYSVTETKDNCIPINPSKPSEHLNIEYNTRYVNGTKYDTTKLVDESKQANNYSDNPKVEDTRDVVFAPRRRIFSDTSACQHHQVESPRLNTHKTGVSMSIFADAMAAAMGDFTDVAPVNSGLQQKGKNKQDKQRVPSCREMLFND